VIGQIVQLVYPGKKGSGGSKPQKTFAIAGRAAALPISNARTGSPNENNKLRLTPEDFPD
jgi:hypothetical protein